MATTKRPERSPEDKKRFASLMLIFFTVFIDLVGFGIVIPVLQPYALEYGATDFEAGMLIGVFSLFQFFFAPVWGWLSDRFGRKPILLGTLLGTALSYVALGMADSLWVLFAGRIMAGVFAGNIAVAQAYIADVTPPEKRAHGMALIGMAFGFGFILGPAIGGILSQYSYALPAYAAAVASTIAFLLGLSKLNESLKPENRRTEGRVHHPLESLSNIVSDRPVVAVTLANFLWTTTFAMWETVFVLFVGSQIFPELAKSEIPLKSGYLFAYIGFLSAMIQGGAIRQLVKRFSERALAHAGMGIYAIGSLLFVVYSFTSEGGTIRSILPALTLIALGQALINPTLSALVSRLTSPSRQGEVLGAFRGLGSLGRVVGPISGAALYAWVAHWTPFLAGSVLMGIAILLILREFKFYDASEEEAGEGAG